MAAPTGFVGLAAPALEPVAAPALEPVCMKQPCWFLSLSSRRAEEFGRQWIFVISLNLGLDSQVTTNADRRARLLSTDPEISSLSAGHAASCRKPGHANEPGGLAAPRGNLSREGRTLGKRPPRQDLEVPTPQLPSSLSLPCTADQREPPSRDPLEQGPDDIGVASREASWDPVIWLSPSRGSLPSRLEGCHLGAQLQGQSELPG